MKIRNLFVAGLGAALLTSSSFGYTSRLFFKNETSGNSGAGAVNAAIGDTISINFSFAGNGTTEKWGSLQITLDLVGINIISDAQANTWNTAVNATLTPSGSFPIKFFWQPSDGVMHDNSIDPSDPASAVVTNKGLYTLVGVKGTADQSKAWNVKLFSFQVAAGSLGQTLDWKYDARNTGTGMATRIIDYQNKTVDVTDNFVKVVPEPGSFAAIGAGLVGLLALRRRK